MNLNTATTIENLSKKVSKHRRTKSKFFKEDLKREAVTAYKQSGLSKLAFAHAIGISDSILHNWVKKYPAKRIPKKPIHKAAPARVDKTLVSTLEQAGRHNLACALTHLMLALEQDMEEQSGKKI